RALVRRTPARGSLAVLLVVIALFIVSTLWIFEPRPGVAFTSRDWILVTTFNNRTGDPEFNDALDTAFGVSLEQSQYANVFPRTRVDAALRRMKKEASLQIDEVVGQEVALREGVRAVVIPSIAGIGSNYFVAARIRNPVSGVNVRTESIQVSGKDQVLPA